MLHLYLHFQAVTVCVVSLGVCVYSVCSAVCVLSIVAGSGEFWDGLLFTC